MSTENTKATKAAKVPKTPKGAKAPKAAKAAKPVDAPKSVQAAKPAQAPKPVQASERLINLLIAPHVSEKAARASEKANQYVFRVRTDATKPEIRAAVELMFSVEVGAVQVVNVGGKHKRFGTSIGKRSDWKKAYVSLKSGQTIDFTGAVKA